MGTPILIGSDRAVVRIASGEYIAVDTYSIDSIPYLLGQPIEDHALFVFRCFLHPAAVVLDIEANFGLYTAVAGRAVRDKGQLYSFEGNPHTFDLLLRTLFANRLANKSNIVPANLLVSDRCGRGVLNYAAKGLGGATMTPVSEALVQNFAKLGISLSSVENEMTSIDAFLPGDLAVDLVKIDIEGHEPLAMRGMAQTIARSPHLRLIIEFNERFLAHTVPAAEFLREIREFGFSACKILRHSRLELVQPDDIVHGHSELLLTRTPEEDMRQVAAARSRFTRHAKHWVRRIARNLREAWERW